MVWYLVKHKENFTVTELKEGQPKDIYRHFINTTTLISQGSLVTQCDVYVTGSNDITTSVTTSLPPSLLSDG
jgi:hypothetical protein